MQKRIRKELVTLPYYGVFDNLAYQVEGNTVTLSGQVVRPSTRSDAARRVAKLAGVGRVINNIEVLPLSPSTTEFALRLIAASSTRAVSTVTRWGRIRPSTSWSKRAYHFGRRRRQWDG
jgi:hypothetical protein